MRPGLDTLDGRTFDLVVVGAGINGAAAAQAAAEAGYRVALVDKGDYGSGSSSRSSRLLHCGLRYLAPGGPLITFALHPRRFLGVLKTVRRSMAARSDLVRTMPHRLVPLRMHFPVFRDGPYAPWQLDAAFGLLKTLSDGAVPLNYSRRSGVDALAGCPFGAALRDPQAVTSVAAYDEYQFDWPERIVVDIALAAERAGATVRNHTEAMALKRDGDEWRIELRDAYTDARAEIGAKAVLNIAGVWIDEVNARGGRDVGRRVTGTKGSHLVFRLPETCRGHGLAGLSRAGRPFYCMPWRDLHFFGPTETLYEGDLDDVHVTPGEVEWILGEVNDLFPGFALTRDQIVSTWAGIRPLTHDPALPMGARSRRIHDLSADGMPGVFALTNGSLGAHRSSGAELLAAVAPALPSPAPGRSAPIAPATPGADLAAQAIAEHAVTLEDVLARRIGTMWDADGGLDSAQSVAEAIAPALGWSASEIAGAVASYRATVAHLYGVPDAP